MCLGFPRRDDTKQLSRTQVRGHDTAESRNFSKWTRWQYIAAYDHAEQLRTTTSRGKQFQMSAGPLSLPKSLGYNPMPSFSVAPTNTSIGMTTFGDFGPLRSDSLTTQCKMMPVRSESTPLAHMGHDLPADIVKVQKFAILKISPMKEGIKLEKKFSW